VSTDALTSCLKTLQARPREENELAGVLTAPDATLHTAELADGASAAVIVSRAADRAAFVAADLPALSADKV
jgi:hypothetical protein